MSSINPLPTTKVAAGSTSAGSAQALQDNGNGVFSSTPGSNFFDIILARLATAENNDQATAATPADTATTAASDAASAAASSLPGQSDNPLVQLQVALASQNVDANGNIIVDANATSTDKLKTQLDFTNQIINHLKNMLPNSGDKDGVLAKVLAKLQTKSDNLQASLSALEHSVITKDTAVEDIPMPMLISFGLSPSQITQVTDKIQDMEKKLGREITVEDLISGVGGIVPPAPDTTLAANAAMTAPAPVLQNTDNAKKSDISDITGSIDENSKPTDDLAARLNSLSVGSGSDKSDASTSGVAPEKKMKGLPTTDGKSGVDPAAQDAPQAPSSVDTQVKKPLMNFKENLVNMMNSQKSQNGDMLFSPSLVSSDSDTMGISQQYGLTSSSSLSLSTTAQAASTITTTALATEAHPATGMVAANIIKFANNGGNQTMQIRLDPPELGNVAVRLQIAKDKGVKAHLVIEKPETYMMLQRDSNSLERALQHAGLDTNASSITFELANQDGGGANNNSQNDNDNFGGKSGLQDAGAGDEIIQSSVNWQVDSSTGHVRYNLFA